jgi:uncharacterized membrane protein
MSTDDSTGATPGDNSGGTGGTPGGTPGDGAGGYGAAPPPPPPGGYGSYGGTPGGAPPPYPPGGSGSYGYPQPEPYSPGTAIGYGWRKFWQNAGPILLAVLAIFVAEIILNIVVGAISGALGAGPSFTVTDGSVSAAASNAAQLVTSFVFGVLGFVITFAIQAAIIRASLDITYGRPVRLDTMVQGLNLGQVLLTGLIIGVAATIGFALCILPGLVVWFLTAYALYFVVDKDMPAIEAIRASFNLVSSNVGVLLGFFLLAFLVYLLGAIACLVGLLVAMPVVLIAQAYTYRVLQGETVAA